MATRNVAEHVGANVRAEMARRRISQTSIADEVGMTQSAISRRLRGVTPFDVSTLALVAACLNVPVASLIDDPAAA